MKQVSVARISQDKDNKGKILWYFKQISPFTEDSSSTGSIANEVATIEEKDLFKYSLTHSEKVKTWPLKASVKLSSKGWGTIVLKG